MTQIERNQSKNVTGRRGASDRGERAPSGGRQLKKKRRPFAKQEGKKHAAKGGSLGAIKTCWGKDQSMMFYFVRKR